MKKFLIIIFSILFCFKVIAGDNYSDFKKLNNQKNPKKTLELVNQIIMAYDLELSFMSDCISHLKTFKEKNNKFCDKVLDRASSITVLTNFASDKVFQQNILDLAKQIDNRSFKDISVSDFEKKLDTFLSKNKEFIEKANTITFLIKNL